MSMGCVRVVFAWVLLALMFQMTTTAAQADVFQTPAGSSATASVTLNLVLRPRMVTAIPKNHQAEIRTVENPTKSMNIYYQFKPLGKTTTLGGARKGFSKNGKDNMGLQLSMNPLGSGKGTSIRSLTQEVGKGARKTIPGTIELATVFF